MDNRASKANSPRQSNILGTKSLAPKAPAQPSQFAMQPTFRAKVLHI